MSENYILKMDNIHKSFPGVKALDGVQLYVRKGTIHAFMGENGAGKSTLMKTLIGLYQPDEGTIQFKGNNVILNNTHDAITLGISMIHQELNAVPHMTVAENIYLGREPYLNKLPFIDHKKMQTNCQELLSGLEINISPNTKMIDLSVANMQMIEIAKAISYDSDLIIMDEPTSAITEKEVGHLFRMINKLKDRNVAIIYITHKMDEVFKIADEVTVLRDGKYIGTYPANEMNNNILVKLMVGRELNQVFFKDESEITDVKLRVENLSIENIFQDVSFDVRKGEIFGIAGLMGAGRTEVIECLFGITKKDTGKIYIDDQEVTINTPQDAIKNHMALLTEDRKLTGCFLVLSVRDNLITASVDKFLKGLLLDYKEIDKSCNEEVLRLGVKTPSLDQQIKNLSGGNQQKVLLSRWLLTAPDILILDEPTRGIDVGAKAEIHKLMSKLAQEGKSIIMISSELPEVLGMSDRVMVMSQGKVSGIVDRKDATPEKILHLATGASLEQYEATHIK
jgi:inositol transport system ATP-binding protein